MAFTGRIAQGCKRLFKNSAPTFQPRILPRRFSSNPSASSFASLSLADVLVQVQKGSMSPQEAEQTIASISSANKKPLPEATLESFANLDHTRSFRTGFPEVVFAETKTARQVSMILDDMARHVNERMIQSGNDIRLPGSTAILATRYKSTHKNNNSDGDLTLFGF